MKYIFKTLIFVAFVLFGSATVSYAQQANKKPPPKKSPPVIIVVEKKQDEGGNKNKPEELPVKELSKPKKRKS